jgi:hypothetical protein
MTVWNYYAITSLGTLPLCFFHEFHASNFKTRDQLSRLWKHHSHWCFHEKKVRPRTKVKAWGGFRRLKIRRNRLFVFSDQNVWNLQSNRPILSYQEKFRVWPLDDLYHTLYLQLTRYYVIVNVTIATTCAHTYIVNTSKGSKRDRPRMSTAWAIRMLTGGKVTLGVGYTILAEALNLPSSSILTPRQFNVKPGWCSLILKR